MRNIHLLLANLISQPLKAAMVNGPAVRPTDGLLKIAGIPAPVELDY